MSHFAVQALFFNAICAQYGYSFHILAIKYFVSYPKARFMASYDLFHKDIYIARRERLLKSVDSGLLLIMGNNDSPMNYKDNIYQFRQDSNFLYFFGLAEPQMAATLDTASGEVVLYGYDYTIDDIVWVGPTKSLLDKANQVGVSKVKSIADLKSDLERAKEVHYLPSYRDDRTIFLSEAMGKSVAEIKQGHSDSLIKAVISQRSIKSSEEVAEMEKAVNITRKMHLEAMRATRVGRYEYEVVAEITRKYKRAHTELAYPVIFSVNGQTLHNHSHANLMQDGQIVLNDSGASNSMFYAGDITRVIPVNGRFSSQQKEIYDIVLEMETSVIDSLKAGDLYQDHHIASNKVMLSGLRDLGLVKGDVEEMSALGVGGLFMPHGLGHMIGLDVHDMEDLGEDLVGYSTEVSRPQQLGLKSLRLARRLEEGFVLTVEPGIYFIPELINKYKAEKQFVDFVDYGKLESYLSFGGIRIEDNVHVSSNGGVILGNPIPKTTAEVEQAYRG